MALRLTRCLPWAAGLLLAGCCFPVREHIDKTVCEMAAYPLDLQPPDHAAPPPAAPDTSPAPLPREVPEPAPSGPALLPVGAWEGPAGEPKAAAPPSERLLLIPPGLPGAGAAPPPVLPRADLKDPAPREKAVERLYPPLPPLGPEPPLPPGPSGHPLTLSDLQRLAQSNSPQLRQAAADVEAAWGEAVQAGLPPNPTVGYQADQVRQADTAGLQGVFIDQTIRTAGKLKLAQARAGLDLKNAEVALGRARFDLMTQVRSAYFGVLAARENVRVARALVEFTDRVYRVQVDLLKAGQAAAYEPSQLRVLAVQARNSLVQARNRHTASWKALAATLGLPALPPTDLAGRIDMPVPLYSYDAALARVLSGHTDVLTARTTVARERVGLRLAQVTPVPDVNVGFVAQKDNTTPPFNAVFNLRVGLPLPVWDRNQGNVLQAQARLERSLEGEHRARNDLTTRLAEAFDRYASNRAVLDNYQRYILADQVRAFRGAYDRHRAEPDRVGFGEVVVAQQTLAASVTTYVTTLGAMWTAVVDVANLLQTEDLFGVGEAHCPAPVPDLAALAPLPCCHPCSPLPDPAFKGADGSWPPAAPGAEGRGTPARIGAGPGGMPPAGDTGPGGHFPSSLPPPRHLPAPAEGTGPTSPGPPASAPFPALGPDG